MKRKVMIIDLDGTISDSSERKHYVEGVKKDFKTFYEEMGSDKIRADIWAEVVARSKKSGAGIVFLTGRPEEYRYITETWLEENDILPHRDYGALLMRQEADHREDTIVKKELFDEYLSDYEVECAYDDRPKVIRMWKECGFEVVDVGDGKDF